MILRRLAFMALLIMLTIPVLAAEGEEPLYEPVILQLEEGETAESLEARGITVWRVRGDMALALIPQGTENTARKTPGVKALRKGRKAVPTMDVARTYYGASRIHTGEGLPAPYTGKGVVTGFCDTGFDPMHLAFLDAEGHTRVRRFVQYDELHGVRRVLDSEEEMKLFPTDTQGTYHATHVAGIMAGGYRGNQYYGMAPDAEIVATTSTLYDVGLLAGIEDVIEYANEVGKPAVVNLSVGCYTGPHDGSTLFNRYLALLGKEAIICLSAGNDGNRTNSYRMDFTESRKAWNARIHSSDWKQFEMRGLTEVWSADTRPIGIRFFVLEDTDHHIVYELPVPTGESEYVMYVNSDTAPEFAKYYTGEILITAGINPLNGRWCASMEYDAVTETPNPNAPEANWSLYNIGFQIYGEPGVHADVQNDGHYSRLVGYYGYPLPTSEMSISDLVTGENLVSVGMYNNRRYQPTLEGGERDFNIEPGHMNSATGYGTLIDGRTFPHTVAPGAAVISAYSRYYLEENPEHLVWASHKETVNGETYYWGNESGTSMSCPYTAGTIATWLEAAPGLGIEDVLNIIETTNRKDYPEPEDPRHGHGWLDPYEGLKMAITAGASVGGTVSAESLVRIVATADGLDILNPSGSPLTVRIFSADGHAVVPAQIVNETVHTLATSMLTRGIYIAVAESPDAPKQTLKFQK